MCFVNCRACCQLSKSSNVISSFLLPSFIFSLHSPLFPLRASRSNSVHKRPLHMIEQHDAQEKDATDDPGADAQVAPTEKALAEERVAERFDNRRHGIQDDHPTGGV